MKRAFFLIAVLYIQGVFVACSPIINPAPLALTSSPQITTPTQTATPVWFPATPTNTPPPTIETEIELTPTKKPITSHGDLLLLDDFSEPTNWQLGTLPTGNMALGKNELSLVVNQDRGYLFSLRSEPVLQNFYLEITASPSICRAGDEYGLLLRVSPSLDFYRFSLTCDGQVRIDRYYHGTASSPQPLTMNGAIPPGAPSVSRLGVMANGGDMDFYANNQYLFSISDPSIPTGSIGVFVRAGGPDMVTVSFSDLAVYQPE